MIQKQRTIISPPYKPVRKPTALWRKKLRPRSRTSKITSTSTLTVMQRERGSHDVVTPIVSVKGKWRKSYFQIYLFSLFSPCMVTAIHCNWACSLTFFVYKRRSLHRKVTHSHGSFLFISSLKCPPRTLASISSTAAVHLHFGFHPSVAIPLACVGTKRAWYLYVPTAMLFPGIFKTYLCYLPLLRNSAVIATHKIAVKVGVAIMGESDLPLEDIDR